MFRLCRTTWPLASGSSGSFIWQSCSSSLPVLSLRGRAISAGRRRGLRGVYAYVILSEGALLPALGCADLWLLAKWRESTLVLGLAFLMGLQNAVVTRISG